MELKYEYLFIISVIIAIAMDIIAHVQQELVFYIYITPGSLT